MPTWAPNLLHERQLWADRLKVQSGGLRHSTLWLRLAGSGSHTGDDILTRERTEMSPLSGFAQTRAVLRSTTRYVKRRQLKPEWYLSGFFFTVAIIPRPRPR